MARSSINFFYPFSWTIIIFSSNSSRHPGNSSASLLQQDSVLSLLVYDSALPSSVFSRPCESGELTRSKVSSCRLDSESLHSKGSRCASSSRKSWNQTTQASPRAVPKSTFFCGRREEGGSDLKVAKALGGIATTDYYAPVGRSHQSTSHKQTSVELNFIASSDANKTQTRSRLDSTTGG